jgi:hypothetical protein
MTSIVDFWITVESYSPPAVATPTGATTVFDPYRGVDGGWGLGPPGAGGGGPATNVGIGGTDTVRVEENEVGLGGTEIVRVDENEDEGKGGAPAGPFGASGGPFGGGAGGPPCGLGGGGWFFGGGGGAGGCSLGEEDPPPSHVAASKASEDAACSNGDLVRAQMADNCLSWTRVFSSSPNAQSSHVLQAQVFVLTRKPLFAALQRP